MFDIEERQPGQYWMTFAAPFSEKDGQAYIDALYSLAGLDKSFVVIAVLCGDTPLSQDNRRKQNLWFKQNRDRLGLHCQMLVRISQDCQQEGPDPSNYGKAMPFPVINVKSPEDVYPYIDIALSQKAAHQ